MVRGKGGRGSGSLTRRNGCRSIPSLPPSGRRRSAAIGCGRKCARQLSWRRNATMAAAEALLWWRALAQNSKRLARENKYAKPDSCYRAFRIFIRR
jgi:hypothetical protein